jgi:branched-chain amino acid transport system permease protein
MSGAVQQPVKPRVDAAQERDTPPVVVAPVSGARAAWVKFGVGFALIALLIVAISGDEYWLGLLTMGLLFAGLASAWNIIGGFGGQFSLGHGVFFAVGAYAVALLQVERGWSPWLALVVGAVLAAGVALVLAWPVFRLRGHFLAIGTLALSQVALALANHFGWTGGPQGVRIPFNESAIADQSTWPWVMFVFLVATAAIVLIISRSRLGYYLIAVRENEDAADAAGADPLRVKLVGLVISAALTGVGGGLFAMYVAFVDPTSVLSIADVGARFPLLALIGGLGTIAGPIIGALIVQPGEMYLRGELSDAAPGISLIIVGALFVLGARFFPRGIWGAVITATRRIRARRS